MYQLNDQTGFGKSYYHDDSSKCRGSSENDQIMDHQPLVMVEVNQERKIIRHLNFEDQSGIQRLTFGTFEFSSQQSLDRDRILAPAECELYARMKINQRRAEFLAGRFIAKQIIISRNSFYRMSEIPIINGVWGFPLIYCDGLATKGISIAHTQSVAAALYAPQTTHPVAIDVEDMDPDKMRVLQKFVECDESILVDAPAMHRLYLLWSAKESAGKALRTGFGLPHEYLKIRKIARKGALFNISYQLLPQISAIAWFEENRIFSIAFPSVWRLTDFI